MEENTKSKIGFFIFIFIVLFLGIGGYFFTDYMLKEFKNEKKEKDNVKVDYKIDKKKDYIYYINDATLSEDAEIYYKDVVINLSTQSNITENLENENKTYKNNIKYIKDAGLLSSDLPKYWNNDIYSMTFREYKNYEYNNYVSLLVNDFNYSCFDYITFTKTKSYIFDVTNGKSLNEEEILKIYKITMDDVKEKMRTHLNDKQSVIDDVEVIKIDETINDLNNYAFYINDYGHLYITYLVKTTQVDYNEEMEVD